MQGVKQPNKKQVNVLRSYFKQLADEQSSSGREYGIVEFMYKNALENPEVKDAIRTNSTMSTVMTYLREQDEVEQIRRGHSSTASLWNVRSFIQYQPSVEVEVVEDSVPVDHNTPSVVKEPTQSEDNGQVLQQIHESLDDMIGYLQMLPTQMTGHLRELGQKLNTANPNYIGQLRQENHQLKEAIEELEGKLEQANTQPSFSEHAIYRQRNLILDEVDRMLTIPAWQLTKNKKHYRGAIKSKLDNIMHQLKIDKTQE